MPKRLILLATMYTALAAAHPMGNFSVNHYARFEPGAPAARPVKTVAPPPAVSVTAPAPVLPPPAAPGQVVKGDYLSRLLHREEIGWRLTLIGILVAFGLGAIHAMSPGH